MASPRPYPINLNLAGKKCLVVGAGAVAARKVGDLLDCGALVTVVSPEISQEMETYSGSIELIRRPFAPEDTIGAQLIFAATDNAEVNEAVRQASLSKSALVNVADNPAGCDFQVPSRICHGDFLLTVSTGGVPALTKSLRRALLEDFGPEYGRLVALVADARRRVLDSHKDSDQKHRKEILNRIVALPLLEWIRQGDMGKAQEEIDRCISQS